MNRRDFTKLMLGVSAAVCFPNLAFATEQKLSREIMLKNIHTGEAGAFKYLIDGEWMRPELERLNHLLRDFRSGDMHVMDVGLLEQLYQLQQKHGKDTAFEVISGYRSPKTNAMLRSHSNGGVAKKSLHMQGRAIDIAMPGVALDELHASAMAMQAGGVGKYTGSGFIHIDTGAVRHWGV